MRPLTAETLRGVWASLLLPLNDDDSIDFARLRDQVDHLTGAGLHGLYAHGTAGEFQTLTEGEFDQINYLLARVADVADGVPLVLYNPPHAKTQVGLRRRR